MSDFDKAMMAGDVSTPRKKWGKNSKKSSPNSKGCAQNNGGEHDYQNFDILVSAQRFFGEDRKSFKKVLCLNCGKRPSPKSKNARILKAESLATLVIKDGEFYEVEFTKNNNIKELTKMWENNTLDEVEESMMNILK